LLKNDQEDGNEAPATPAKELGARRQAHAASLNNFYIVVSKADSAESESRKHSTKRRIGGSDHSTWAAKCNRNEHAAMVGVRLLQVRLRAVFADELADLKLAQHPDDPGPMSNAISSAVPSKGGAEREVAKIER